MTAASCLGMTLGVLVLHLRIRNYKWTPKNENSSKRSLLSPRHIKDGFMATFKKRESRQRSYIVLLCLIMIFVNAPFSGEAGLSYLYVRTR